MQKLGIAIGAAVLMGLTFTPSVEAASNTECLGAKPNVFGTSGNDTIQVSADEAGASVTINGKTTFMESWDGPIVIWSKAGNDKVSFTSDGGGSARVCTGDGDDTVTGTLIRRIHTGSGYDTVTHYIQCGMYTEVFKAEAVRATVDTSGDLGPCN